MREQPSSNSVPRPSATVIPVRPGTTGFEVFMARRVQGGAFGGVFVFPGGSVQADDFLSDGAAFGEADALAELSRRGGTPPENAALARALFRAAARELFEEAGILLADDASTGLPADSDASGTVRAAWRAALQRKQTDFSAILQALGITPAYRHLIYFSHWITPAGEPRRFDTRFFVARAPADQLATHAEDELTESLWIAPADALARADAGQFPIVFPTRQHLLRLAAFASPDALVAFAGAKPVHTVCSIREVVDDIVKIRLPDEVKECW
ncbi:MAG TPA: NUDIX hydrolase [Chloroflexota bacterium]|nr:NUDIX hydrolase [Chloroflexota bacterium]